RPVKKAWLGFPPRSLGWPTFDAQLAYYARTDVKGRISVRRVTDDRELAGLPGHLEPVLRFSPGSELLASGCLHETPGQAAKFRLWDWRRGKDGPEGALPGGALAGGVRPGAP